MRGGSQGKLTTKGKFVEAQNFKCQISQHLTRMKNILPSVPHISLMSNEICGGQMNKVWLNNDYSFFCITYKQMILILFELLEVDEF